jgi:hypothetical protein
MAVPRINVLNEWKAIKIFNKVFVNFVTGPKKNYILNLSE